MTAAEELSCRELVELVTDYFEGALPDAERRRFQSHLDGCPGCRDYLEQLRQTLRLVGHTRERLQDEPAVRALLAVFHDWKRSRGGAR